MGENIIVNENNVDDVATVSPKKNIFLPSGVALSPSETYLVTASEKSRLVVLLGAVGSGKTAICTSIYSCFSEGKFQDEYYFAGSKTLATFEENAYLTRTVSGGDIPTHERTKKGRQSILHIRAYLPLKNSYTNCLISDFSGEDYENAICNVDYAKDEFQIIRSATVLVVVLDGEKMCKASTRISEIQQSINLLRTFHDANLIANSKQIIILVSKFDLVHQAGVTNWYKLVSDNFNQQLSSLKNNFLIKEVAPLSKYTNVVDLGHGIRSFFKEIMKDIIKDIDDIKLPKTESQFEVWGRMVISDDK